MAPDRRLSCCHVSSKSQGSKARFLNARVTHVCPILNLEISAQCWHTGLMQLAIIYW